MPANCGYAYINLRYTDGDATGNMSDVLGRQAIYCGACKPGYLNDPHLYFPEWI